MGDAKEITVARTAGASGVKVASAFSTTDDAGATIGSGQQEGVAAGFSESGSVAGAARWQTGTAAEETSLGMVRQAICVSPERALSMQ